MGVSIARVSQIEHGEVTSFEVIARYVEALGGRLDLVADFGDRTVSCPSATPPRTPPNERGTCLVHLSLCAAWLHLEPGAWAVG
jgi:hypothetical protein